MEEEFYQTPTTDSGDVASASSEGQADDKGSNSNASFSLKTWAKQELGKEYASDEEAAKALKQLNSYVGEYGEVKKLAEQKGINIKDVLKQANQPKNDFVSKEQYEQDMFYSKNPKYNDFKTLISSLSKTTGKPVAEVIELEDFKRIYSKAEIGDEVEKSKSVITSNPRLGVVRDKVESAKSAQKEYNKAIQSGDFQSAEQHHAMAKKSSVDAVIEAYDL